MARTLFLIEGECGLHMLKSSKADAIDVVEDEGVDCVDNIYEVKVKSVSIIERTISDTLKTLQLKDIKIP